MISLFEPKRILVLGTSLTALSLCFASSSVALADGDSTDDAAAGSGASFILTQPQPYTRAHEYFTTPAAPMSTLSPNAFTSGLPYVFGNSYYGYGSGGFPLAGVGIPGGVPVGGWNNGYGGWGRPGGWGGPGGWGANQGFGWGGYGTGYGASGFGVPIVGAPVYGGFAGAPLIGGYGGFGGYGGIGSGYGYGGNPFTNGGFGNGYWGGYGMSGFGGYGYGGYGGYGGIGGMGFGGGTSLGLMQPSHVVQTEPSKASGNYYAPSTVDTTASGSYYAQTSGTAVQIPAKRPSTNSNYWKQDSSSNYWGSGGGSSTPFGKDLNSVPWNK